MTPAIPGVFFPRMPNPDAGADGNLPFDLQLVKRDIAAVDIKNIDDLNDQIDNIVTVLFENPTDNEMDDGFFPIDSYGVHFSSLSNAYDPKLKNLILKMQVDNIKGGWISDTTKEIVTQALIATIKQLGSTTVSINYI